MGTVYRARDTVLDREVALKTIRTGVEVEPELRERFYREARACARLQHPSIVVVHDLGEVDRTAYIAMELLNGFDFRKIIDSRTDVPLPVKIEAMAQVCEALAHAHRHGIIHRDVKPSNLFLVDNKTTKVLDFGIAHLPSSKLTVAGKILGTPNYMAPEQILVKPTDARSDLFSAAMVFFEFLVFAHPFKGDVIPRRVVESDPDSLFDYDSKLPVLMEKILERALAKDPDRRYQTGDEMAADLRAVLDAVLQNASPTFSRVQLPSDREVRAAVSMQAPSQADASLLRPPPPGEDPHEWRLSELMRLIPEFEAAAGRHDLLLAGQAFRQLEAIGAVDSRFVDAVQLCRVRLDELASNPGVGGTDLPPSGPADSSVGRPFAGGRIGNAGGGDQGTTPKTCGYCGAANRSAAAYCIRCGGGMPAATPAPPTIQPEPRAAAPEPVPIDAGGAAISQEMPTPAAGAPDSRVNEPVPGPHRSVSNPLPPSALALWTQTRDWIAAAKKEFLQLPSRQRWLAGGVAGTMLCLVLAWILVPLLRTSPIIQPAVGTARVRPERAALYKEASMDSTIATLVRGDQVNVLTIPNTGDKVVLVQFVGGKVLRPGYMRISDLNDWDSRDPDTSLSLILMFASDNDKFAKLQQLTGQYPGTITAHKAQLEMAKLDVGAVQQMRNAGQPLTLWQNRLESARSNLEGAKSEPSLNGYVEDWQRQIDGLAAEVSPGLQPGAPSATPGPAPTVSANAPLVPPRKVPNKPASNYAKGLDLYNQAKPGEAEKVLEAIPLNDTDYQKARDLLRQIQAERILQKY
jgi:hypothetical protein